MKNRITCGWIALTLVLLTLEVQAGTVMPEVQADMAKPASKKSLSYAEQALHEDAVAVEVTTGFMPSQFFNDSAGRSYSILPAQLSVLWSLDDIGNDEVAKGWFRGNTAFRFTSFYYTVLHGPESRFAGFMAGPQYNFVQPGWNLVPFVGAQVGLAFTDSGTETYAQGQDFCFTFAVNAGVRYFLNEKWSVVGELAYQHFSNGGLSEPAQQNNGLDLLGPQVSVAYGF